MVLSYIILMSYGCVSITVIMKALTIYLMNLLKNAKAQMDSSTKVAGMKALNGPWFSPSMVYSSLVFSLLLLSCALALVTHDADASAPTSFPSFGS